MLATLSGGGDRKGVWLWGWGGAREGGVLGEGNEPPPPLFYIVPAVSMYSWHTPMKARTVCIRLPEIVTTDKSILHE